MLQHLFIFTAWRGWSTISSSVRNLGRQEASRSIKFSSRPGSCCSMGGSLESSSWAGELVAAGGWGGQRNEWDPEGMRDTWRMDALVVIRFKSPGATSALTTSWTRSRKGNSKGNCHICNALFFKLSPLLDIRGKIYRATQILHKPSFQLPASLSLQEVTLLLNNSLTLC